MKKSYLVLFITVSLIELISGIYFKYYKSYLNDIRINVKTYDGELQQRHLDLSEIIGFLEEQARVFAANGVELAVADKAPEALQRLKSINGISIVLMLVSGFVFLGSLQKLNFLGKGLRMKKDDCG